MGTHENPRAPTSGILMTPDVTKLFHNICKTQQLISWQEPFNYSFDLAALLAYMVFKKVYEMIFDNLLVKVVPFLTLHSCQKQYFIFIFSYLSKMFYSCQECHFIFVFSYLSKMFLSKMIFHCHLFVLVKNVIPFSFSRSCHIYCLVLLFSVTFFPLPSILQVKSWLHFSIS